MLQLALKIAMIGGLSIRHHANGVESGKTRSSGSRVGFRLIDEQAETLGEFRYVDSMPFIFRSTGLSKDRLRVEDTIRSFSRVVFL